METIKYELKYCEGCGTLKLRPVCSANTYCLLCERMLARFRFPRGAGVTRIAPRLPSRRRVEAAGRIPLAVCGADRRREGAMSAAAITAGKPQLRAIDGGPSARGAAKRRAARGPDALFFRSQTLAIVRHFFEIACQIGRLPSILGREFFRAKVSHHADAELRGAGGVCARCGAGAGAVERAGRRGDRAGWAVSIFAGRGRRDTGTQSQLRLQCALRIRSIIWRRCFWRRDCCGKTAPTGTAALRGEGHTAEEQSCRRKNLRRRWQSRRITRWAETRHCRREVLVCGAAVLKA